MSETKLTAVTPSRIRRLYKDLATHGGHDGSPISANTIRKAHVVLGSILDAAVDDHLIPTNPARRTRLVRPPTGKQVRAQAEELVTWSLAQVKSFLDWDRDEYRDRDYTLWLTLAMTGMRRSEALALRWSDVDVDRQRIAIRRAADSIEIGTTKLPKNSKARVVDVDDDFLGALRTWRATRGAISLDLARPSAYLFGDAAGLLINPNRVTNRWSVRVKAYQRAHPNAELPSLPLHGLRHSHATALLEAGVHPRVVQERLGHSTITITMEIYSHVTDTMQRDATDRLTALFRSA